MNIQTTITAEASSTPPRAKAAMRRAADQTSATAAAATVTSERRRQQRSMALLPGLAARATSPELVSAIDALIQFLPGYADLADAHTVSEEQLIASKGRRGFKAKQKAEAAADRLWIRAIRKRDDLARAILEAPVTATLDALIKQEAFQLGLLVEFGKDMCCDEDISAAQSTAMTDLRALTRTPPPAPCYSAPDPLLALTARMDALVDPLSDEHEQNPRRYTIFEQFQALTEEASRTRARSVEGALIQIAIASADNDLLYGSDEEDVLVKSRRIERLLCSAMNVLWPKRAGNALRYFASTMPRVVAEQLRDDLDGPFDAEAFLERYRELGGNFSLHFHDGDRWFGNSFARDEGGEGNEMSATLLGRDWKVRQLVHCLEVEEIERQCSSKLVAAE